MNYDRTTVLAELDSLIGFKNPLDTVNYIQLAAALLVSDSGEYYNNLHPILKAENIQEIAPNVLDFASATSSVTLSAWYENLRNESIITAVNDVFNYRKDNLLTKDIKVSDTLAIDTNELTTNDKVGETDTYVGVEIQPFFTKNGKLVINKIGVRASSQFTFKLYFKSTDGQVIAETPTLTAPIGFNWISVNKTIYLSSGVERAQIYAYVQTSDFNTKAYQIAYLAKDQRYLNVLPCTIASDIVTNISYYPFDLDLNVGCDLTQFIIDNKYEFVEPLRYKVGIRLMEEMLSSTRDNSIQSRLIELAKYDLDGADNINSIRSEYKNVLKRTYLDFSLLDRLCLPCAKKQRVKYRTV